MSEPVRAALHERRPVVALESTVLAHGLPRPQNVELGREAEAIIRRAGAVPATVAVIGGVARIGLSEAELEHVANADDVLKLSTRDLPVAMARGRDGATTVAATMWLAHRGGVEVFATGGIGGVHRGELPDVSADLTELQRTPMLVVCSGAKSILDLPATREALETAAVPIVGWRTDELPAFYSRRSGLPVDVRAETPEDVVGIWRAHRTLELPGSVLVCVPPPEPHALDAVEMESVIARALEEAEEQEVKGKEITPFLLRSVAAQTGGRSLQANLALLRNNAQVAAQIVRALATPA
jgi:pseudouridylate synthase